MLATTHWSGDPVCPQDWQLWVDLLRFPCHIASITLNSNIFLVSGSTVPQRTRWRNRRDGNKNSWSPVKDSHHKGLSALNITELERSRGKNATEAAEKALR